MSSSTTINFRSVVAGAAAVPIAYGIGRLGCLLSGDGTSGRPTSVPSNRKAKTMKANMQGHNHGGKNHLLGMISIGALVLVVPLASGSALRTALPFAALLACPLMMGAMMFMMMRGGNSHQQGDDAPNQGAHNDATDHRNHDAPERWQDSPNLSRLRPPTGHEWPPGPAPSAHR